MLCTTLRIGYYTIKNYLVALRCGIILNIENWLNAKSPTLKPGLLSKESAFKPECTHKWADIRFSQLDIGQAPLKEPTAPIVAHQTPVAALTASKMSGTCPSSSALAIDS